MVRRGLNISVVITRINDWQTAFLADMKNQSSKGGKRLINLQTSAHENCTWLSVLMRVEKGGRSDVGKEKIANLVYNKIY